METATIRRDARVFVEDGELGRVKHVIIDPETREVTHLVVRRDGDDWLIPTSAIERFDGQAVTLYGDRAHYYSAAMFNREDYHEVDETAARDESEGRALHGGAPLLDAEEDAVAIGGTQGSGMTEHPYTDMTARPSSEVAAQPSAETIGPTGEDSAYHLQLKEERLNVTTEPQQAGAVRVSKRITERLETVTIPVREERLVIEVMPGSGRVRVGDHELLEGETLEVLLMEERAVAGKELIVSEDVVVRKETMERQEEVRETLRKEELVVDESEGLLVEDEGPTADQLTDPTVRLRRPEGLART